MGLPVTVPLGFSLGSGVTFFALLLWEEHTLHRFDSEASLSAFAVAFWFGVACAIIAALVRALLFLYHRSN
jgi:ATP/ADP translocase